VEGGRNGKGRRGESAPCEFGSGQEEEEEEEEEEEDTDEGAEDSHFSFLGGQVVGPNSPTVNSPPSLPPSLPYRGRVLITDVYPFEPRFVLLQDAGEGRREDEGHDGVVVRVDDEMGRVEGGKEDG